MSATERKLDAPGGLVTVTKVECDFGACTVTAHGRGSSAQVRDDLNQQGWGCSEKARTDFCPEHHG